MINSMRGILLGWYIGGYSIALLASPSEKEVRVASVYDNIATAMGLWERPELIFDRYASSTVAAIQFTKNQIIFEEKAYDLCATFGERTDDAIALILGHELAHYKMQHNWGDNFTSSFALGDVHHDIGTANVNLEQMHFWETQADQLGGIYAYLGGYNTMGIAESLFKKIYDGYGFPEKMDRYPSLADRIAIADQNEDLLWQSIQIFETGNYALLTGEYDLASNCYEHVIRRGFAAREVYNNHGVALAQKAIAGLGTAEVPYLFPLEMDLQARLEGHRGGDDPNTLLKKAALRFQQAAMYDPEYATALVNLACVHTVMEQFLDAHYYCKKAKAVARETKDEVAADNASLVEALVLASEGDKKGAEKILNGLAKDGNYWAAANLEILSGKTIADIDTDIPASLPGIKAPANPPAAGTEEEIDGFNIYESGFNLEMAPLKMGTSHLMIGWLDKSTFIYYPLPNNEGLIFHSTDDGYDGKTKTGISLGSSVEEVVSNYGMPAKVLAVRHGLALYYEDPNVVFFLEAGQTVGGWMVYRKLLY